jgi:pentatricopeptide repeat protein
MVAEGLDNAEPSKMIDMCSCAIDAQGVVRWFDAMAAAGCRPTEVTFTSAIKAYGYKKNVRAAEFWFEAMRMCGFSPNEKAYSSIINAYARAKDVDGAEMWFRKMRDAGLQPDHVVFNIMINAYTTVKDLAGAERWFDDMRAAGFGRSQPLYASMAIAYATARRVPFTKVKMLVEDMRIHGLMPDYDTLSSLLKSCSRASPSQQPTAAQWFQEFIGGTYLSATIEKTTLPMAVGLEAAQQLCVWARQTHPECVAPSMERRALDGMGALSISGEKQFDGGDGEFLGPDGGFDDGSAPLYSFAGEQINASGDPWGAPPGEMGWQDRPPLYARLPATGDGHPGMAPYQQNGMPGQGLPMSMMQMPQGGPGGPGQYSMSPSNFQHMPQQQHGKHPGHMQQMPLSVDGVAGGMPGGHYGYQHMPQHQQMGMPNQMQPQMQFQNGHAMHMMPNPFPVQMGLSAPNGGVQGAVQQSPTMQGQPGGVGGQNPTGQPSHAQQPMQPGMMAPMNPGQMPPQVLQHSGMGPHYGNLVNMNVELPMNGGGYAHGSMHGHGPGSMQMQGPMHGYNIPQQGHGHPHGQGHMQPMPIPLQHGSPNPNLFPQPERARTGGEQQEANPPPNLI